MQRIFLPLVFLWFNPWSLTLKKLREKLQTSQKISKPVDTHAHPTVPRHQDKKVITRNGHPIRLDSIGGHGLCKENFDLTGNVLCPCVCVCWDVDRGLCRSGAEAKNRKYYFFSHHNEETEKMAEGNARAEQEMWGWKTCLSCPWPCASLPTQNIWGSIWLWHKLYNLQWFSAYNNPVYEPSSRKYLLSI